MQTEVRSRPYSTASIFRLEEVSFALDKSGAHASLSLLSPGNGSFATSRYAASLQKGIAESVDSMLRNPGLEGINNLVGSSFFPMLVDAACFEHLVREQELVENSERKRLAYRLRSVFEIEPLEDGMDHPADQIIENALRSSENQGILDWLVAFSLDTERPNFASSVLRCLGRQTHIGTPAWRAELVRNALATNDIEIRDAAVQAAESWGGLGVVHALRSHNEPESWLQEYILEIVDDLQR